MYGNVRSLSPVPNDFLWMSDSRNPGAVVRAAPPIAPVAPTQARQPAGPPPPQARTADARLLCALLVGLAVATAVSRLRSESSGPPALPVHPWRIDVNHADPAALGALPGVGPSLAARIAAARDAAPFRSADDLDRVPGIGPSLAARIGPHVRFEK